MSPIASQRSPGDAASTSIAARIESGFALYESSSTTRPAGRARGDEPARHRAEPGRGLRRRRRAARRRPAPRRWPRAHCGPCAGPERSGAHAAARRASTRSSSLPVACNAQRAPTSAGVVEAERHAAVRRRVAPPRASHATCGSSALRTARPPGASAAIASACSAATSATLVMNSWCSRCALFTSAIVGRAKRRELRGLAAMVHAELDHRGPVLAPQAQQRERQADRVVEVAFGGEHVVGTEGLAQDRREHLLHRGLAVAAHHHGERHLELRPPVGGEPPQRRQADPPPR